MRADLVAEEVVEIRATYVDAGPELLLRWETMDGKRHEISLRKGEREPLPDNVILAFD